MVCVLSIAPAFVMISAVAAPYAANAAVVPLFIPDSRPVAVSADFLGTDAEGHTTWRLAPGEASGTLSPASMPTATIVTGPKDIHLVEDVPELGATLLDDCVIADSDSEGGGVAVCTVRLSSAGGVETVGVRTQSVRPFEVQVASVPPGVTFTEDVLPPAATKTSATTISASPFATGAPGPVALGTKSGSAEGTAETGGADTVAHSTDGPVQPLAAQVGGAAAEVGNLNSAPRTEGARSLLAVLGVVGVVTYYVFCLV
ncbi:hypothetical protein C8Q76DRAFT_12601 [Earliella scabrosa]|nr:hypothetical protein C8Q76DRAFT_12601 [Earliella scabrosa]